MPPVPPEVLVAGGAAFAATAAAARLLRPPPPALQWGLAVAAATAAAFATDAAPTGTPALDAAYRATLALVVTMAAGRARPAIVVVAAAGAAAVAWPDALAGGLAAAALGMAAAAFLTRRPSGHAVGALASFALLRGTWPEQHGATAAVATAAVALLLVAGARGRWVRRVGLALAGAAVVATASAAFVAWQAADAVERATAASSRLVRTARQGEQGGIRSALDDAEAAFADARRWTRSPLSWPGRAVPVVAQHLEGLSRGADAGLALAERLERRAAETDLRGLQVSDGGVDIAAVERIGAALADAHLALRHAEGELAAADSPWLVGPVRRTLHRQHARVADAADDAGSSARVVQSLPAFLGGDGPRRWFLAVQTPVESRAVGGLMGNFGEVVAEGGRLRIERFGRLRELNRGGNPAARTISGPADYLARYSRFAPATTWQNVNMSPDFPTVAEVIAELYPQSGGVAVDGVVAVDPTALAALLRLTGPVRVPSWPEPLTAENIEQALYFEQYQRYADDDRVDFLGEVALRVTQRLTSMRIANVSRLIDVLAPVVRDRHLMVWSTRDGEGALLHDLGLSGRMPPPAADTLAVVTQNAGGNKIDWFLRRAVTYRAVVDEASGAVEADLDITLRNEAPAAGLPRSIIGSVTTPPLPPGTNRVFLTVYSPWDLVASSVPLEAGVELGRRAYAAFLDIPPGGSLTVHLSLRGVLPVDQAYRLDVLPQPTVVPDEVRTDVAMR